MILIGIFEFWGNKIIEFLKNLGEIREILGADVRFWTGNEVWGF